MSLKKIDLIQNKSWLHSWDSTFGSYHPSVQMQSNETLYSVNKILVPYRCLTMQWKYNKIKTCTHKHRRKRSITGKLYNCQLRIYSTLLMCLAFAYIIYEDRRYGLLYDCLYAFNIKNIIVLCNFW